ncbi:MAG: sigma-70 family RNA polymerase sigma factor [Chitinispirillia bacterium]|nr:sigma-70 family RNA polymerase sigma factor [Chitinispirillia bacterium]MCL2269509.1 sigma-70 family RNA polymerase sigma factor [Chitinispirillia bacterium]
MEAENVENTGPAKGGAGHTTVDAAELFRKYWPMVLRRCRSMLGDTDRAVDAAQEVFIIVHEKQDLLHADHPVSLLWRMATNQCLKEMQRYSTRFKAPGGDSLLERIACAGNDENRHMSRGVLQKLFGLHPESSRTIAVLHLVDGFTLEETAKMVNMSVNGVRKRLQALRDTLKELEGV